MTKDDQKDGQRLEDWFIVIGKIGVLLFIIFVFVKLI